jgi:dTDP-4-amino-4,6-dideoxygalactose transaminase
MKKIINFNQLDRVYKKHKFLFLHKFHKILQKGTFILGNEVLQFENSFKDYIGTKHCVGLNSGLDALILAIRSLNIKEGDEVIVPANTYIATVLAITENKATPVFVEPDDFYNIDSNKIESKISNKTKAIIVVHLFGQSAKMDRIVEIKNKYNLFLIEDCAQSHGATFQGKMTGTFGDIGCFSFYPTKNIGAYGDGGCVTTNNQEIATKIKLLRNYGSSKKYYNDIQGLNTRLDELQAGLLNIKLKLYPVLLKNRTRIANYYLQNINNSHIEIPKIQIGSNHVFHLFVVRIKQRDYFQNFLQNHGIGTVIHYPIPPHLSQAYKNLGYSKGSFPITESQSESIISLPIYDYMNLNEAKYVVKIINSFKVIKS